MTFRVKPVQFQCEFEQHPRQYEERHEGRKYPRIVLRRVMISEAAAGKIARVLQEDGVDMTWCYLLDIDGG